MKATISFSVLILAIMLTFNNYIYSQSAIEIDSYFKNTVSSKSTNSDLEKLRSLYYDFNATAVLSKENVKIVGEESPKVILVKLSDISAVYQKNRDLNEIEILIINIENEKYAKLDLNNLNHLPKLKYIVLRSDVLVSSKDINSLLANPKDGNYILLYDISIAQ
ncbi:MAG: hypothetical protein PHE08_12760 [Bacteroidales bacterium]|nr:hypothetical protein [Bacteroidales bacterium]MDD4148924.1 hypothetical protein [Bacteroidales bacterium]